MAISLYFTSATATPYTQVHCFLSGREVWPLLAEGAAHHASFSSLSLSHRQKAPCDESRCARLTNTRAPLNFFSAAAWMPLPKANNGSSVVRAPAVSTSKAAAPPRRGCLVCVKTPPSVIFVWLQLAVRRSKCDSPGF